MRVQETLRSMTKENPIEAKDKKIRSGVKLREIRGARKKEKKVEEDRV